METAIVLVFIVAVIALGLALASMRRDIGPLRFVVSVTGLTGLAFVILGNPLGQMHFWLPQLWVIPAGTALTELIHAIVRTRIARRTHEY